MSVLAQAAEVVTSTPDELKAQAGATGAGLAYGLAAIGPGIGIAFTEALALIGFVVFILLKFV